MPGPFDGVTVLDAATLFAGPLAATMLGDFGADVIKIEHPRKPDPARGHGPAKEGVPLWWAMLGRNKRTVALDLGRAEGAEVLRALVAEADVLIENFRPGTLERWGLGPEVLHEVNPGLIVVRVSGFGQFGPYASRPGFGTLAEAMSGFAAVTGEPDGPPTLPPFGLADGVTAQAAAFAAAGALLQRASNGGNGQVIDIAVIEPLLTLLGAQATIYDQLGTVQQRTGNRSVNNAPRNTYRTKDDRWVVISTSAQSIAERVMALVGHPEVVDEPWFATGAGRAEHGDLLDTFVADWIAVHELDEVVARFEEAQAAVAPVYDIADVLADPQYQALDSITTVQDERLGPVRMQNVLFRMSRTPGSIRWTGRRHGEDTTSVLTELAGLDEENIAQLESAGVIATHDQEAETCS